MQTSNTIEDGYTRGGYIEPIPRLHQGMYFEYRPMLPEEVADFHVAIDRAAATGGRGTNGVICQRLADHIKAWSEVQPKSGEKLPIKAETIKRLPPALLMDLRGIVQGSRATNLPPNATDDMLREFVLGKLAEGNGKQPGIEQLRADQGN